MARFRYGYDGFNLIIFMAFLFVLGFMGYNNLTDKIELQNQLLLESDKVEFHSYNVEELEFLQEQNKNLSIRLDAVSKSKVAECKVRNFSVMTSLFWGFFVGVITTLYTMMVLVPHLKDKILKKSQEKEKKKVGRPKKEK